MPGLRDIAKATGLSVATVSRALRHDPKVGTATRRRVMEAAERLGYKVNPYVGKLMSSLRRRRGEAHRGNLALIWFDQNPLNNRHPNLAQMRSGALQRAEELGYSLNELVREDYTPRTLRAVLRSRGIRGILIAPPISVPGKTRFRLALEGLAAVSLGWAMHHPPLHSVRFNHYHSIRVALHHAAHHFGPRIAGIWDLNRDRRADHVFQAGFLAFHPAGPETAHRLFFDGGKLDPARLRGSFRKFDIECLILGGLYPAPWLRRLIPSRSRIHLDGCNEEPCFGWIDCQYGLLGKWGIDLLTDTLQREEYGIPETPKTLYIPGLWQTPHPSNPFSN